MIRNKYTRTAFALAIGLLLAYGIGSASADCCSPLGNTCATSGMRSSFAPSGDADGRTSPRHCLKGHDAVDYGAQFTLHGSKKTAACCQQTSCFPVGTTVYLGNSRPSPPLAQQAGTSCIIHCNYGNLHHFKNRNAFYDQSAPIYILTKTIIC